VQGSLLLQLLRQEATGASFARPLDGGSLFVDGQPMFGPSKTIRGIVVSVILREKHCS
jgi:CDP-2,3-bis-(O-geranylgeranyl)-sn-glycerol synthase